MEIAPSSALIAALSDYSDSRSSGATDARQQEKARAQAQQANAPSRRVPVSSESELQAARDAALQADDQAAFRREAPTAGTQPQYQPPGQIIDISV
jgi:hypothetical protein